MTDIYLELSPVTGREHLKGIGNELIPDDRILSAVSAHGRLFPHVVMHLALNQYNKDNPEYVHNFTQPANTALLEIMRGVRDDLVIGLSLGTQEVVE